MGNIEFLAQGSSEAIIVALYFHLLVRLYKRFESSIDHSTGVKINFLWLVNGATNSVILGSVFFFIPMNYLGAEPPRYLSDFNL